MNLFIFVCCALIAHASGQYYYFGQPAIFHIPQINPSYSTFHGNPNYYRIPGSVSHFQTVPGSIPNPVPPPITNPIPPPVPNPIPPPIPNPIPPPQQNPPPVENNAEYRGFAYQTSQNGASSHVLFLTGPQAHQINRRVYNNFKTHSFGTDDNNSNNNNRARNFASDMVDTTLPNNIQDIYTPPTQRIDNGEQFFRSFFQATPQTRLINFYSINDDLFAQPAAGYPADVFPLTQNLTPDLTVTNNTEERNDTEAVAESIRTDTRFRINVVDDEETGNIEENNETVQNVLASTENLSESTSTTSRTTTTETVLNEEINNQQDVQAEETRNINPIPSLSEESSSSSTTTTTTSTTTTENNSVIISSRNSVVSSSPSLVEDTTTSTSTPTPTEITISTTTIPNSSESDETTAFSTTIPSSSTTITSPTEPSTTNAPEITITNHETTSEILTTELQSPTTEQSTETTEDSNISTTNSAQNVTDNIDLMTTTSQ